VNAFSERFLNALRSRLPGLLPQVRPWPDAEAIELRVLAPSGHGELSVITIGDEVTVGFGPWHSHFEEFHYWPDGSPQGEPFERVMTLLTDFLRDLVVIRVWTKDGAYAGSAPCHWWYGSEGCHRDCLGDHYSMISWTGRGDLLPPVPVDVTERKRWFKATSSLDSRDSRAGTGGAD
jgi:hypothetical protein